MEQKMIEQPYDVNGDPETRAWEETLSRDELLVYARNWKGTAAMHLRNEEYWRERCLKAEGGTGEWDR